MKEIYWGNLMHIGYNMWLDEHASVPADYKGYVGSGYNMASSKLRFDWGTWNAMIDRSVEQGVNMVVIDLGEGIQYESHPELAVEGSLTIEELRKELARLRSLGITPIPKLNFALTHNNWMGPYKRMPTSDIYNKVCVDVISEVCDIFDTPPMFHLGMDEEEAGNNIYKQYAMFRQFDLWWHDLFMLFDACEKKGVRPALWSDRHNLHPDEYMKRMTKDAVQFHWYYWNFWENVPGNYWNLDDPKFNYDEKMYKYLMEFLTGYHAFEKAGFDQIPTGSFWNCDENFENLTEYARQIISPEHLLGFMQTSWKPTVAEQRNEQLRCIDLIGKAKRNYRG